MEPLLVEVELDLVGGALHAQEGQAAGDVDLAADLNGAADDGVQAVLDVDGSLIDELQGALAVEITSLGPKEDGVFVVDAELVYVPVHRGLADDAVATFLPGVPEPAAGRARRARPRGRGPPVGGAGAAEDAAGGLEANLALRRGSEGGAALLLLCFCLSLVEAMGVCGHGGHLWRPRGGRCSRSRSFLGGRAGGGYVSVQTGCARRRPCC